MAYHLEIYEPGSLDDVLAGYQRETPFGAISKGDVLNVHVDGVRCVEVVLVEHFLFGDGSEHKTMLFTRAIEDTREERRKLIERG